MEERDEFSDMHLKAGKWLIDECNKLLKQYRSCKTEYARNRLRKRLEEMKKRLGFQSKENLKLMGYDDYNDNRGNETV